VSSGTAALTLVLLALKELHPDRDQVLMPAFACYSVPSAIVRAGLKIALCDIDPDTLDFDFEQLPGKLANPRLLCVIPIHLFGLPADIGRLKRLLRDPAVTVVEDAAQAMGGEWKGEKLGTLGDVGFFSLGRGKALSAVEGGVILTDCDELGQRLRARVAALPDYDAVGKLGLLLYAMALLILMRPTLFWLPSALPFLRLGETRFDPEFRIRKMTAFQAGLTRGWQNKLASFRQVRLANVRAWAEILPLSFCRNAVRQKTVPDLIRFPFLLHTEEEADALMRESARLGLGLARTYPDAVSGIAALREEFSGQDFPCARLAARRLITLPVHGYLTGKDRERILRLMNSDYRVLEKSA
jgi:dTDP-4-amino-4,6-dideoxygalactose transaminase